MTARMMLDMPGRFEIVTVLGAADEAGFTYVAHDSDPTWRVAYLTGSLHALDSYTVACDCTDARCHYVSTQDGNSAGQSAEIYALLS